MKKGVNWIYKQGENYGPNGPIKYGHNEIENLKNRGSSLQNLRTMPKIYRSLKEPKRHCKGLLLSHREEKQIIQ